MADYSDSYLSYNDKPGSRDSNDGQGYSIPNINIGNLSTDAGSPVNVELLGRSQDIKKQLSASFQGNSGISQGGISKPQSRRNSTYYPKSEEDDDNSKDEDEQGNERKRRDNINERIQQLLTLIPSDFFQDSAKEGPGNGYDDGISKSTGTKDGKPNKGQILSKAVEYIQSLQALIDENNRREVELLLRMKTLQLEEQGKTNVPISVGTTSAELALGDIGVGPHAEKYFKQVLLKAAGSSRRET